MRPVMLFPWRLYIAASVVGALAGLVGAGFHALLEQGADGRGAIHAHLESLPVPGWLLLMVAGALVLLLALWLVRRFAPETAGSGVQEVEAILAGERSLRWQRVLPVKFVAGTLAVGSGLVLGREGPTIHMGAALGQMTSERLGLRPGDNRALIAAGAAAGLATAFNAPLASIVFVTEELREHFEYRFATIQSVILACSASVIVSGWLLGQGPDMPMPKIGQVPLTTAPLFLILGLLIGILGVLFNRLILGSVSAFRGLGGAKSYVVTALAGALLGALLWFAPATVGGGEHLVESLLHGHPGLLFLLGLLAVRLLTTVGSYGLGLPGGIFAPMLALGTICGAAFAALVTAAAPAMALEPAVFAIAAMGALFAATVRAPLTGIILVIELTSAETLALPIILTCLTATFTAEGLGGRPIYSALLGLPSKPAPKRPVWRIAAGAAILAGFIVIEQLDVAWEGTGMGPIQAVADSGTPAQPHAQLPGPITSSAPREHVGQVAPPPVLHARSASEHSTAAPIASGTSGHDRASDAMAPREASGHESLSQARDVAAGRADTRTSAATDATRYSIQLISFRQRASLSRFAQERGLTGDAMRLASTPASADWHAVLLGRYPSRAAAEAALRALPAGLRALEPVIRRIPADESLVPIRVPPEQ